MSQIIADSFHLSPMQPPIKQVPTDTRTHTHSLSHLLHPPYLLDIPRSLTGNSHVLCPRGYQDATA